MLELTGMDSVLRGAGPVHWRLAIGAVILITCGAGAYGKVIAKMILVAACGLLPAGAATVKVPDEAYAKEAWAYFKKKCETEAGEKIYKTYTGVKSVLVVKPLPPATEKDLYDQFWYGDPYSNATPWDERAQLAASILADPNGPISIKKSGRGFDFVETSIPPNSNDLFKIYFPANTRKSVPESVSASVSRFGIAWEDVSTPEGRKYWIAKSRLRVIDLSDNNVVAERIGFFIEAGFGSTVGQRRPWLTSRSAKTTCPSIREGHYDDRWFILKVLNPLQENQDGK